MEAAEALPGAGFSVYQQDGSAGTDRQALMEEIRRELDSRCLDFGSDPQAPEMQEELALAARS